VEDGSVGLTPPRLGRVEYAQGHKFLAGPEGLTCVGGLIVNNKINLIIHDLVEVIGRGIRANKIHAGSPSRRIIQANIIHLNFPSCRQGNFG
jgi:hypothetical protein